MTQAKALVAWKDELDSPFWATVQLSLDAKDDDENVFFYFNGEDELSDALNNTDTIHDFIVLEIEK